MEPKRNASKDKKKKESKVKDTGIPVNLSVAAKAAAKRQAITELLFFSCVGENLFYLFY